MSSVMPPPIDLDNPTDESGSSAEAVFEAIHSVMHLYRAEQYRALRDGPDELTHMDGKVLGFFAHHPGATQKELALKLGRDKGQLARLIGGLKERGLLDAKADEADRRSVRLHLTAQGRSLLQALRLRARKLSEQAVADLSADERAQLVALLLKVAANLGGGR